MDAAPVPCARQAAAEIGGAAEPGRRPRRLRRPRGAAGALTMATPGAVADLRRAARRRRAPARRRELAGARDPGADPAAGRDLVRRRAAGARAVRRARAARGVRRGAGRRRASAARCSTRRPRATRSCARLVAARLGTRGLPTEADDVLITSGSQQALTLIAAVLIEPGDTVLVEEPSYLAALQCFQMAGARVVPVPCDDDGLDPEAIAGAGPPRAAQAALHGPDVPQPDRPDAAAGAPPRARAGRRAARAVDRRGRPVRRAALPRRAGRARRRRCPAPRTGRSRCRRCRRCWSRACGSAGCGRRRRCAARWSSPSRRPTCTRRRSTRPRPRTGWTRATSTRTSPGCARSTRRAATRWSDGLADDAARGLALDAARRRHVRLGPAAGRLGRRRAAEGRAGARGRVRPGLAVLPGRAGPRDAAAVVHHATPRPRSPRAWAGCARPC